MNGELIKLDSLFLYNILSYNAKDPIRNNIHLETHRKHSQNPSHIDSHPLQKETIQRPLPTAQRPLALHHRTQIHNHSNFPQHPHIRHQFIPQRKSPHSIPQLPLRPIHHSFLFITHRRLLTRQPPPSSRQHARVIHLRSRCRTYTWHPQNLIHLRRRSPPLNYIHLCNPLPHPQRQHSWIRCIWRNYGSHRRGYSPQPFLPHL